MDIKSASAKEDEEYEQHLRRVAIEVVGMLPHDSDDALKVLQFAKEVLMWSAKCSDST